MFEPVFVAAKPLIFVTGPIWHAWIPRLFPTERRWA